LLPDLVEIDADDVLGTHDFLCFPLRE